MDFERYTTSAYGYWDRSRRILSQFEQSRHALFYAAYELRCAIEAFLYDYLYFLHDGDLSKNLRKLYSTGDLRAEILKFDPHFEKRIEFDNLVHEAMGVGVVKIPVPDLPRLGRLYGALSQYVHIQKDEMDRDGSTIRWDELQALVKESQTFLHDLVHPQKSRTVLTEEGMNLFEQFRGGMKSASETGAALKMDPKKYISGGKLVFGAV